MTENKRYKVNFESKGGSFNADQFAPRIERSYYNDNPAFDEIFVSTDFKEKNTQLSFDLLKQVSIQVAPIAAVISTRIDQVGAFTSRSKYSTNGVGFKVKLRDNSKEPRPDQEKTIDKLESFIENCGNDKDIERDNFDTFIRKILRDSLTYDQVNFELEYDITGEYLQAFEAVDASTIKPTLDDFEIDKSIWDDSLDPRDGEDISYVQVIDNRIIAGFNKDEMAFSVRNPRTDVKVQPYGLSEIEVITRQLTSYLEAEDYNMRFFQQGGMTKGILNIKGEKNGPAPGDRQTLESFKRQWRTQVTGQKGAWKIPVFTLPGELEFINIAQSGGEMVFEKWINYLINIICAVYKIDPAEINFPNNGGVGGKGSSLFSGDKDKVDQSKAKGLLPLLQYIENVVNKYIISRFSLDDEYVFVFDGLDNESESEQVDLAKRKTESYMTINEVRADKGLAEIEGGDIIANPYFLQSKQMMPSGDSMDFDFDSYGDDEDEPDPGGEDDTEIADEETSEDLFQKSLRQVNMELEKEKISIDDLKKSIDRSKLVLVEVEVKGKNGTYRAKRWKNLTAALKEIKKQMKLPKGATLTFVSKRNKNKILNEKQFKNYCRRVKPNVTLQQFIKSNFVVKVNRPIINNKNKRTNEMQIALSKHGTEDRVRLVNDLKKELKESDKEYLRLDKPIRTKLAPNNDNDFTILGISLDTQDKLIFHIDMNKSAKGFSQELQKCYDATPEGKQVSLKKPHELINQTKYAIINENGNSGAIVTNDGEISAVFTNGEKESFIKRCFPNLIKNGGYWLNCFNSYLPGVYASVGFKEVSNIPFSEGALPDEFDKEVMYKRYPNIKEKLLFMSIKNKEVKSFTDWNGAENYAKGSK